MLDYCGVTDKVFLEFHDGKLPPLLLKPKPSSMKSKMDEKGRRAEKY